LRGGLGQPGLGVRRGEPTRIFRAAAHREKRDTTARLQVEGPGIISDNRAVLLSALAGMNATDLKGER